MYTLLPHEGNESLAASDDVKLVSYCIHLIEH